jgi:hypothetical protein
MKIYEKDFLGLQARSGHRTVWTLGFPSECEIRKVVATQTGGATATSFTLDIFNSKKIVQSSGSSGGGDPEGSYTGSPDIYRVLSEPLQGANGRLKKIYDDGGSVSFSNKDGGSSNKERRIYLEINIPAGADDDTTWDVSLGAVTDVG